MVDSHQDLHANTLPIKAPEHEVLTPIAIVLLNMDAAIFHFS